MIDSDLPSHAECSLTCAPSYFPYSRQSKKKSHRGSITARMIANLLTIAGVDHVITLDLHVRCCHKLVEAVSVELMIAC